MITVVVLINEHPIFTRSARNLGYVNAKSMDLDLCEYKVDTGDTLYHKRSDGFVPLVKQMLDTIDEAEITNGDG
jgi:hypothetical protein